MPLAPGCIAASASPTSPSADKAAAVLPSFVRAFPIPHSDYLFKLLLIGDSGVGKSVRHLQGLGDVGDSLAMRGGQCRDRRLRSPHGKLVRM